MSKQYTWQEVAKHNTEESCWIALDRKVYDVTGFLDKHPGGKEYLLLAAGRDCTDLFHSYHNLTHTPASMLPKYQIGELVGESEFTQFKPDTGFYKECCEKVGDYFKKNKLHPKDPVPGLVRFALFLSILATCYYTTYFSAVSFPVCLHLVLHFSDSKIRVLTALIYGWFQAMILIHQMHDSCHSALGYSPSWWKFFGRLPQEWIAGASMVAWHNQHVIGHHVYTNIMGADPDLPMSDKGDLRRIVKRQVWTHFYRYQHIYMPLLYGFLTAKVRLQDFTETFINRLNGPIRVNPISIAQWVNIILAKIGNLFYLLAIPMIWGVLDWKTVLLMWVLQDLVCGYYLAFNFQVSHVSSEAYFPCENKLNPNLKDEWAVAQVVTSVDYGHENNIWAFLSGALNYQTIHHLFPGVSQYHYPAIAPIVQEVCKKWKVPYNHIDGGLVPAVKMHIQYLREMGTRESTRKPHPYSH